MLLFVMFLLIWTGVSVWYYIRSANDRYRTSAAVPYEIVFVPPLAVIAGIIMGVVWLTKPRKK